MEIPPHIDFQRPIPLFPLPNCVLFPGAIQPLHIFEPRYQQLLADTLNDQSAIALALLQPGWEKDYYSTPPVHDILCVGKIITHEHLPDGKYNLLLHGITRARILAQHKPRLYRTVNLDPIPDSPTLAPPNPQNDALQPPKHRNLLVKTALNDLTITPSLEVFFDLAVPLPRLIDVLAFNLIQDIPTRQRLLEELCPNRRSELLTHHLIALAQQLREQQEPALQTHALWPPSLSTN